MLAVTDDRQVPAVLNQLWDRRAVFAPFAALGSVSVLTGGIVAAAIAAPHPTRHGVWAVAYLVLVGGVSQIALGAGQALLTDTPTSAKRAGITAVLFNLANIGVLTGVISGLIPVLHPSATLLMVTLGLCLYGVRGSTRRGWPLYSYRLIVAVLALSIPIGLVVTTLGPR